MIIIASHILFLIARAVLIHVRSGGKSPGQEVGFGNRGRLKVLNDTKLVLNEQELIVNPVSCPGFFLPLLKAKLL